MAKKISSESYKKATIDKVAGTITEYLPKDVTNVYSLEEFINRWDGVDGVNISISKDSDITPVE
jgi:hypothetical protein